MTERASFEVSYWAAKAMKQLTIGKTLILATPVDMVRAVCRNKEAHTLTSIPLLNNMLKQRSFAIASNQRAHWQSEGKIPLFMLFKWMLAVRVMMLMLFYLLYEKTPYMRIFSTVLNMNLLWTCSLSMAEKQISWYRMVGFCTDHTSVIINGGQTLIMDVAPSAV